MLVAEQFRSAKGGSWKALFRNPVGCASLGADRDRADVCDESGACDCSTEPGSGACPVGESCCSSGCTNTNTDFLNCGFCSSGCTDQADNCSAGTCRCGSGPVCDFINMCIGGSC